VIVLAVDTATESCSVAVVNDNLILSEINLNPRQTHSKHLMPAIDRSLAMANRKVSDLQGLAVTRGPGSFTGLRIGISTVKGLAVALNLPLVGVSTLDALAMQAAAPDFLVCPVLDARKKEVYCATYRLRGGQIKQTGPERVMSPQRLSQTIDEPSIWVGSGATLYRDLLLAPEKPQRFLAPQSQHLIRAATVAQLAIPALRSGQTMDVATLEPVYIRQSEAQVDRNAKIRKIAAPR
jgi:tRNA threonylcarbamoyladenosine biosynthesis protein TsaB